MEQAPKEQFISQKLLTGLSESELAEYREIKEHLKEILSKEGEWSSEFGAWMDENLRSFGMLGKSMEAMSGLNMKKKKTAEVKKDLEHYKTLFNTFIAQSPGCSPSFISWVEKASPEPLKQAGMFMDYAANTHLNLTTNQMMAEHNTET